MRTRRPAPASQHALRAAQVKAGVAWAALDQPQRAAEQFSCLLAEPVDQFADLFHDAGGTLLATGQPQEALRFFRCVRECVGRWRVGEWVGWMEGG